MRKDYGAMENKEKQIKNYLKNEINLKTLTRKEIDNLFDNYVTLTPPDVQTMSYIALDSLSSGYSAKLGNITVDIKKFFNTFIDIVISGVDTSKPKWEQILVIITIVNKVRNCAVIKLNKNHAIVLFSLNKYVGFNRETDENELKNKVIEVCKEYNEDVISDMEISKAITDLSRYKCIKLVNGKINLIERICGEYC